MQNKQILQKVKQLQNKIPNTTLKAITYKEITQTKHPYRTCVLARYSGGKGLGFIGSKTVIEIKFKTKNAADKLTQQINIEVQK